MFCETYGIYALSASQFRVWSRSFQSDDFEIRNEKRGRMPTKFEDSELEVILSESDTLCQQQMADILKANETTISLCLQPMGEDHKSGK